MTFAQRDAVAGKCVRGAVIYRIDRPIDVDLWPECEPFWRCVFGGGVGGVYGPGRVPIGVDIISSTLLDAWVMAAG